MNRFPFPTAETFEQSVPRFIREDRNGYALMRAIGWAMGQFMDAVAHADMCLTDVENMPQWALDEYAACRGIRWYDADAALATKRMWIRDYDKMHSCVGTREAIEHLMRGVYENCAVEEWSEYGGEPYHFRVRVYGEYDAELEKWARAAIAIVKNCRSMLDSFAYGTDTKLRITERQGAVMVNSYIQCADEHVLCGDAGAL